MKFFRKINIGAIVLLLVLASVFTYMFYMSKKHEKIEKEAESFLASFFKGDANWATIPEEYRQDSKGYIESIEKDVKKYFYDDGVYDYYIKYTILAQYENNLFLDENEHEFKESEFWNTKYDGKTMEIELTVDMGDFSGYIQMTLIESDNGFKISCLNYPIEMFGDTRNHVSEW